MDKIPIGYKAICLKLHLDTFPHYRESYIAKRGRGKTIIENHHEIHIFPKTYNIQNEDNLFEHLVFALKYEGFNLLIIKAFFESCDKKFLVNSILQQPTGMYSRKIWYLYEFLMGSRLNLPDIQNIKYVDLMDPKFYFTNTAIKSPRHAINNNLLGNSIFCPFVRKTAYLESCINERLEIKVHDILKKYEPNLIVRASHYLYAKETMSSYEIEREQPDKNRATRFITLLQQAAAIETLSKEKLIELQNIIVDPRFADHDYRDNQNYIGENIRSYFQKIHYIPPKPQDTSALMEGLLLTLERMLAAKTHPVIIAAVIAFGFVFIHPFEDGNGRIHRFLIHYILSKQEFAPKDLIFPVSSVMLNNMRDYDIVLESFSKPLLSYLTNYHLSDDGEMTVDQDSKIFYQYIDFTQMAEYLFSCIREAIENYIERELQFLINYDETKKSIQQVIDMPDNKIDLLIKLLLQNNGNLSESNRKKHFSMLTRDEINQLLKIVSSIMLSVD